MWGFAFDDADQGTGGRWFDINDVGQPDPFSCSIVVPFPPESAASTVADTTFHPRVWYRRTIAASDLTAAGRGAQGESLVLHFGAVDYCADVWLAGVYLGRHYGGSTPFSFDITAVVATGDRWALVVRAEDDPNDVSQPRGKQDWQADPHGIWYHRTTGIWQSVWLEAVPALRVQCLSWQTDVPGGTVTVALELNQRPMTPVTVSVTLTHADERVAHIQFEQADPRASAVITLPSQSNGQAYERLLWSPENPLLLDACIEVMSAGVTVDRVESYLGLRSIGWADGHFLLNDRPYYLRAVLEQGYWPETHLAAPNPQALREEVQLIKDMGFNSVRIHEKVEDPRFLYWTDRLGLLVWAEAPSAYEFSPTAIERSTSEWLEVLRRDSSHPSIGIWVPLNESWGVQHVGHDPRQLHYAQALYHLTRAVDGSRPVISNDGWEHADSDLWTVHDYSSTGEELRVNYADEAAVADLMSGIGPLGRRMKLLNVADREQPVIVSEFGGISFAPTRPGESWGYITTSTEAEFHQRLSDLFTGLQSSPVLAGFCYTQLTDTLQEANGLTDPHRKPKIPLAAIRAIVTGEQLDVSSHRRPKQPVERVSVAHESSEVEATPPGAQR